MLPPAASDAATSALVKRVEVTGTLVSSVSVEMSRSVYRHPRVEARVGRVEVERRHRQLGHGVELDHRCQHEECDPEGDEHQTDSSAHVLSPNVLGMVRGKVTDSQLTVTIPTRARNLRNRSGDTRRRRAGGSSSEHRWRRPACSRAPIRSAATRQRRTESRRRKMSAGTHFAALDGYRSDRRTMVACLPTSRRPRYRPTAPSGTCSAGSTSASLSSSSCRGSCSIARGRAPRSKGVPVQT